MHQRFRNRFTPLMLAIAALSACGTQVVNPVSGRTERSVMTESDEITQGREQHKQVLQEYGVYANPRVQALVTEVGRRLAAQTQRPNLPWTFTVLDSPEINAFALPGGYVYVTRGIMAYLQSEADLAGVIGHEIGHVTARHGAQRATRAQSAGLGVIAATVLGAVLEGAGVGGATQIAGQLSQTAAAGYVARYSREQESQADALGAEYLVKNRYDPRNMVDVIRLLLDQERYAADAARAQGAASPPANNWLASHPGNAQRLADIQQIASRYGNPANYADDGRQRYLQTVNGMNFGESREQGVTRGRNFYHEPLGIALTAPSGWKVQNRTEAIVLIDAAGAAGVVVRVVPRDAGTSHDDVLRKLNIERASSDRGQLNGLQATRFSGLVRNEQGQPQPAEGTLVSGPGGQIFLLTAAASDSGARGRAQGGIRAVEESFRQLTAADRAAARPWALRSVAYPRGGFSELARQSPLDSRPEAQLRLLNGYYDGGEPPVGTQVTIVTSTP